MKHQGFTLLELLVVVAIIAFLATLTIPSLMRFAAKAKRSEAYMTLRSLYLAEKTYRLEHGSYTTQLAGPHSLNWSPDGALLYTYGFPGGNQRTCFIGTLQAPASALEGAHISSDGFTIAAAADIDGDGEYDIITIDHRGTITLVKDDCAR